MAENRSPNPEEEKIVQKAAAEHGDRLINNPDGSHQVVSEVEQEQAIPERMTEFGAPRYEGQDGPQDVERSPEDVVDGKEA